MKKNLLYTLLTALLTTIVPAQSAEQAAQIKEGEKKVAAGKNLARNTNRFFLIDIESSVLPALIPCRIHSRRETPLSVFNHPYYEQACLTFTPQAIDRESLETAHPSVDEHAQQASVTTKSAQQPITLHAHQAISEGVAASNQGMSGSSMDEAAD